MIGEANDVAEGAVLETDICVIGSGAAGFTLALELNGTPCRVLVLESGGVDDEADTQALYAGSVADEKMHSPPDRYRQRKLGGSTTIWGGRCMPMDPIDFEVRGWIPHSGWPFGFNELLPYYRRANALCEAGDYAYTAEEAFTRPVRPMIEGFDSPNFTTNTLERFSCPTNFSARYRHRLEASTNVQVLLHANATSLRLSTDAGRVEHVEVATLRGRRFRVRARQVVLAAGGLEVARLLLASRDVLPAGIGNQHDLVGRYYMCHVAGTLSLLRIDRPAASVWNGYDVSDEGVYCRRRFALRAEVQRERKLGNFVGRLHHPRITDPAHRRGILSLLYLAKFFIPYEYGKRLHGEEKASLGTYLKHVRNVVLDPFYTLWFVWHLLRDRRLADRKFPSIIIKSPANRFSLDFHAEQEPNPDSRVTLSSELDPLGVPRLHVDWRYTSGDLRTVRESIDLLAQDLARSGVGRFEYAPEEIEVEMTRYGAYGGHHIGTARMGADAATSVVDADGRVHGVDNLYVAGSAVFPTSSQANPTLTIVALAMRLAQHLLGRQGAGTALAQGGVAA